MGAELQLDKMKEFCGWTAVVEHDHRDVLNASQGHP